VPKPQVEVDWVGVYLQEDLGHAGDVTSKALFPASAKGKARIVAKERLFLAGSSRAVEVFARLGAACPSVVPDGRWLDAGAEVMQVEGPARSILAGERLSLNILSRMSGVATVTRELVESLAKSRCDVVVAGTRKTTPGFRVFEKEAIAIAGGDPHRMGLYDMAMLKDNHLAAAGGNVAEAVRSVKSANPGKLVCCEVEAKADALAAAKAGADWLLIDNQSPGTGKQWAEAVWAAFPAVKIEASGGITPTTVADYAWADRVSLGWLTQKAVGKDFSQEWLGLHE
jgi:nicotinate-nucleotide pyrophosphorylase (carboxylating)